MFIHEYPYTNFHEMNLDWILGEIKRMIEKVDSIETEFLEKAYKYTDDKVASFADEIQNIRNDLNSTAAQLRIEMNDLDANVSARLVLYDNKINYLDSRLQAGLASANEFTLAAIEQNNDYIIDEVTQGIDIRVINYFTGTRVTVQEMFDYLANLHLSDPITYSDFADRNKTYAEVAAYNATYTMLAVNGGTIIV